MKKFKRVVDNKMRGYGDIDLKKKVIRVNKARCKTRQKGEIIDTIVHEELHRLHPKKGEREIEKLTTKKVKSMNTIVKHRLYGSYAK